MPLRLSPSIVDSYEYWRDHDWDDPEQEAAKLAELIAQVKGERFPATRQMRRGTAFHTAMEKPARWRSVTGWSAPVYPVEVDGFEFLFDKPSTDEVTAQIPRGLIREIPGMVVIGDVEMHFRVDGMLGLRGRELKTTESSIDVDKYLNAIQWQVYCLGMGCRQWTYDVVKFRQDSMTGVYSVAEYLALPLYAYGRMRESVEKRVAEVAQWVTDQGLAEYRQARAA